MASDQQFCLRWNNHQSTLVSVFDNLLESQTLVDCTLAADGQYLKAHKVVLSACSPYLEAILCQNLDKHPILILKDVKFSELKAMLDYMYRGEVNISQEQLSTFLKAAESLQIKGLTDSGGGGNSDRDRDPLKRQDLRKPLNQPVPHIPQPRPVVPHPGLMERRSLPHFPPHIADMQPQSPRHAREGSTSPTARKRRRPNRPSSDDSNFVSTPNSLSENQPDTSDSCDVPVKQAASSTPNVPNATTKAPETDSPRTTPQPQNNQQNSEQKQQVTVKKEFTEALLTPKTEFDYGNDNSMEDVTYEDDEEEEVDLSKPGTSFAANSQGFPPWQMGGDGSNDDSNNMYSPDVTAATNQNNSQGGIKISSFEQSPRSSGIMKSWSGSPTQRGCSEGTQHSPNLQVKNQSEQKSPNKGTNVSTKTSTQYGKRVLCPRCGEYILKRVIRLHSKYYCERDFEEKEWKLVNSLALCLRCHKPQEPNSIEFHVKYICGKNPITVQCFYCQRLFDDYKFLLKHMNTAHKKRHCFLDLLSVLPTADSIDSEYTAPKVVRNFFSNMLNTEQEAILAENKTSVSPHLQLRNKRTHKCETCGKELTGTHEYVNHVNTKCESDNHYSCFYCAFKSVLAYEVLDHMEDSHGKLFNTFDIIQARLTGIIPLIDSNFSDNAGDLPDCQEPEMGHLLNKVIKKEREKTSKLKLQTVTSEPVLKNVKKPVETVPSDLNHDGGTMYTVRDEVLEEDKLSHEELNVEAKYVKIKNHEDLALDVLSETSVCNERKQTNSNFKTFGYNLQDKVTVQPRGSNVKVKAGEKSPVPVRGKENVTEPRLNSTDNYLVEETAPEDSTPKSSSKQLFRSSLSPKKNSKLIKIKGNRKKEFSKVNIVSGSVTDKSAAVKSSLGCCSQTVMETGVSPKEKSKAVEIKEESNSQEGNKSKTSPDVCCINEESLIPEDPELDFADKQLYEPFSSPARCLRSASKRVVNLNSRQIISGTIDRNSLEKSKSDKCITVESMSSDPEVDFAKKELFEPYSTPKKDRRSLNIQISSSKKKESQIKTLAKEVRPEVRGSSQTTNKRTPKTGNEAPSQADQGEHEYLNKLKTNNLVQNTKTQRKVGLSVKKRKIIRGNKIIKASRCKTKRNIIKKINCSVCHEDVHPLDMRIHNKYHCGSEPMEKQWILQSGKALCLRCKKIQWSSTIDFHVKYLCNKKRFFLECLYCSKIANCRSVIVHMRKAHGKKHYYQDLMTILPGPEFVSPVKSLQPQFPEKEEEERLIMVVKHPITFHASKKMDVENKEELSKSIIDHSDDYYVCFYCRFKHIIAYKTLDHMEGLHSKKHSLYELLYAKIPTFKQENGLSAVGREAE